MHSLTRGILLAATSVLMAWSLVLPAHANTLESPIVRGDRLWAEGRHKLAQQTFEQAIKAEPRSLALHMKLAGLQLSIQDFNGCIVTYQRAIGLDPNQAKAWIGLGFAYLHTGRNALALAAFNEAMRIDPGTRPTLSPLLAKLDEP